MYYYINNKLKEEMLLSYIKKEEKTKYSASVVIQCILIAMAIALFCLLLCFGIQDGTGEGLILCLFMGIVLSAVLSGIAYLIKKKTRVRLGSPYSEMSKEFLNVDTMGIEFGYHDVLNRYTTSMDVYQIYYEDIQNLEYSSESGMLTITGKGNLIVYDDFYIKRENHEKSQRKFYNDSKYSFFLAFDGANEIINKIEKYRMSLG